MSHVLLVTVPNNRESPEKTFAAVQNVVTASSYSTMSKVEVPNLVVGTLDTLMSLADELGKIGTVIEVQSEVYFLVPSGKTFTKLAQHFSFDRMW